MKTRQFKTCPEDAQNKPPFKQSAFLEFDTVAVIIVIVVPPSLIFVRRLRTTHTIYSSLKVVKHKILY